MKASVVIVMFALLSYVLANSVVRADDTHCDEGAVLEKTFASGAYWTLCASVHPAHGLSVSNVRYRAPGDTSRSVLHLAHLGQILLHYHDQQQPDAQIINPPLINHRLLAMTSQQCDGELLLDYGGETRLCSRMEKIVTMARYASRPSLHGQSWELSTALQRGALTWAVSILFSEDGSISPAVSLSGRATYFGTDSRFSQQVAAAQAGIIRASILITWRIVFDLDSPGDDSVEQFDFPLMTSQGNRRPMVVSKLATETFADVDRDNFRGWRFVDTTSAGYYLDPSSSGFNYRSNSLNWAQFDVAITRYKPCERYALGNKADNSPDRGALDNNGTETCGRSLDDFISNETLANEHPVLWFSQSRTLNPSNEDWPVISNFYQSFTLLPFDWTSSSPFEINE